MEACSLVAEHFIAPTKQRLATSLSRDHLAVPQQSEVIRCYP